MHRSKGKKSVESGAAPKSQLQFVPIRLSGIRGAVQQHLGSLPSAIDSYLEDHITESAHYKILVSGEEAGFTSIYQGRLITQFALTVSFQHHAQDIYRNIKRLEEVQSAYAPTCDEFFLSHALDDYRHLAKHAYFFAARPVVKDEEPIGVRLRRAEEKDVSSVQEGSGDFFGDIGKYVGRQELFLTLADGRCVGFGIMVKSELQENVASIGMYIMERFRRQGAGTATLRLLKAECRRQGLRPVAGCGYDNHGSKKTLEAAGMVTPTRLLKIDYSSDFKHR